MEILTNKYLSKEQVKEINQAVRKKVGKNTSTAELEIETTDLKIVGTYQKDFRTEKLIVSSIETKKAPVKKADEKNNPKK